MDYLYIDLRTATAERRPVDAHGLIRGGRHTTAAITTAAVDPSAEPLGRQGVLVLAGGPLAGVGLSSTGRLSVGGKSPLTGGIKEANAGGTAGDALARLGLRAIVLTGSRPREAAGPVLLIIERDGLRIEPVPELSGLGNFALADRLRDGYARDYTMVSVGPAGERGYLASGVSVTDPDFRPSRLAARGGLGAVLGTKGVKAILIRNGGPCRPPGAASAVFAARRREFNQLVRGNQRSRVLAEYGTASTLAVVDEIGALPTRNFSQGRFEGVNRISGEALHDLIRQRGGVGAITHACMTGCAIGCSNVVPTAEGTEAVSPLEYETLGLMGSNLGLDDLDVIARLNWLANDLGVDTIEVGATLGVMAEAGLVRFGDGPAFESLMREIAAGTAAGALAAGGCALAGRVLGVRRIPVVKHQAFAAYDPRGVKGTGVTFATSPMGADHTAGLTIFAPVDHASREGQLELSRRMQLSRTAYDGLGLCAFLQASLGARPDLIIDLLQTLWQVELPADYLERLGREVLAMEHAYNRAAGLGPDTHRLPEFIEDEALPPFDYTWDIAPAELVALAEGWSGKSE